MRPLLIKIFLLLITNVSLTGNLVWGQDCPDGEDIEVIANATCIGKSDGKIIIRFNQLLANQWQNSFGLYNTKKKTFERNRLHSKDLIISNNAVSYLNLPAGEYQLAIYFKGCHEYPVPKLIPATSIVVKQNDCEEKGSE